MSDAPFGDVRCARTQNWARSGHVLERVVEELAAARAHELVQQRFDDPQVNHEDRARQFDRLLIIGRYAFARSVAR